MTTVIKQRWAGGITLGLGKLVQDSQQKERVICGHCNSTIEYRVGQLSYVSDYPPYDGLRCPACDKTIYKDGSRV